MNDKNSTLIKVTFESNKILIQRAVTSMKDDVLEKNTIKLELSVARIFHKVLNKARIVEIFEKTDYELLGNMLYKILVSNEKVKTFFLNILAEVIRIKESRCRVLLEFKEDIYELAALPWEYLLIPAIAERNIPSFYLAADRNKQFDLVRYVDVEHKAFKPFKPEDRNEINVILISIQPSDPQEFEIGETVELKKVFTQLTHKYSKETVKGEQLTSKFNSFHIFNPRKENLYKSLGETIENIQGPYVLHFYGHAQMREDGPYISLVKDDENLDWVKGKYFIDLFDQTGLSLELPVLIILQACESGQVDEFGRGLGIGLVKKGVPAVVAMQNEVTPKVSLAFVEKLYTLLLEGEDIDHAVTQGRYFLGCEFGKDQNSVEEHYNSNTFGTPVLFTNEGDPIQLMPKPEKKKELSFKKDKYCEKCGWKYVNTLADRCIRNFCGGKLIEVEKIAAATSAASNTQSEHAGMRDSTNKAPSTL